MPIITRKIELWINEDDKDKKNEIWHFLRKLNIEVFRAANLIVSNQYFNETFKERIVLNDDALADERHNIQLKIERLNKELKEKNDETTKAKKEKDLEKLYKQKYSLTKDARERAEELYATGEKKSTYRFVGKEFPDMHSHVRAALNNMIVNKFKLELPEVKRGNRSIASFRKGMPIPFMKLSMRFEKICDRYFFHWIQNTDFELRFGKDKSSNKTIVERMMNHEYKLCDSQIQIKDKKIFLLLAVDIPYEKRELDSTISVGVDLGINVPAYCALSEGYERLSIGSRDTFLRVRTQMQRRRRSLQKSLAILKGGKGREKKLKALDALRMNERNFVRTYNHNISKNIVAFAERNNAGVIKFEMLEGYGKDENGNSLKGDFILRNWSYFELQTMIKDKASRIGIEVVFIDPYHTSQTCWFCNHYEEGQRNSQSEFQCKNSECENFEKKINADFNAAKNISRSTAIVTSKEECTYYKKAKAVL